MTTASTTDRHLPVEIALKPEPDGLGYRYGTATRADGATWRIDIIPPEPAWRGQIKQTGQFAPHASDYVLYVDGQEVARDTSLSAVTTAALAHLATAPAWD